MVEILKTCTQTTIFYKVKAHINIQRNEQADKLAKIGAKKIYFFAQNHTSINILYHFIFKKIYSQVLYNDHIKSM